MLCVSWFGTPLLKRYDRLDCRRERVVHVERALVAELHVVRAGDVGRRGVPGVRAIQSVFQSCAAIASGPGCRRWSAQPAGALFGHPNQAAIVVRAARACSSSTGRCRARPRAAACSSTVDVHLTCCTRCQPWFRPPVSGAAVAEPAPMLSLLICSSQNRFSLLRGETCTVSAQVRLHRPVAVALRPAGQVGLVGPLGDVAGVPVVEHARDVVPAAAV